VRRLPVPQLPAPGNAGNQPVPVPQEDIVTMTGPELAGPGNMVVGGVHRHPFAAVLDEQEHGR
jgi:hypothetical protein